MIAEIRGAHFWNSQPTGSDDQYRRGEFRLRGGNHKFRIAAHLPNIHVHQDFHVGRAALPFQHSGDVPSGAVAKKLPQSFFVVRDGMTLHHGDEIGRRVAGQRRFHEVRIRGEEILGTAIKIGKIAAAAAGNQNLFADARGALQNGYAPSPLTGFNGAHQPRGAAAENHGIVVLVIFWAHSAMYFAGSTAMMPRAHASRVN